VSPPARRRWRRPGRPAAAWGSPGRSALAAARRRRSEELAAWTRTLVWRAPLIAAAGLVAQVLTTRAGLPYGGLVGLAAAVLVGWRLRFRPSEQVAAWQRGAAGERRTARLLDRLTRDGYVVFHDLAVPGSPANVDHLVVGPSGVFVIDSKQWSGSVRQGSDGLVWHNHYRLDRTLETVRWEAKAIDRILGTRTAALVCVHGAHVQGGGLEAQGVAVLPADLLRGALGYDPGAVGRRRGATGRHRPDQPAPGRLTVPASPAPRGPRRPGWAAVRHHAPTPACPTWKSSAWTTLACGGEMGERCLRTQAVHAFGCATPLG
jgi:Nuclease-related domain